MSDLSKLYREALLEHSRSPRHFHVMEDATHNGEGFNPLCGDKIAFFAKIENGVVEGLSFQGAGCAIMTASASILSEFLVGKTLDEVHQVYKHFLDMVTGGGSDPQSDERLGPLVTFQGLREFPARVKCATLAWHTLQAALERRDETVSTE